MRTKGIVGRNISSNRLKVVASFKSNGEDIVCYHDPYGQLTGQQMYHHGTDDEGNKLRKNPPWVSEDAV